MCVGSLTAMSNGCAHTREGSGLMWSAQAVRAVFAYPAFDCSWHMQIRTRAPATTRRCCARRAVHPPAASPIATVSLSRTATAAPHRSLLWQLRTQVPRGASGGSAPRSRRRAAGIQRRPRSLQRARALRPRQRGARLLRPAKCHCAITCLHILMVEATCLGARAFVLPTVAAAQ